MDDKIADRIFKQLDGLTDKVDRIGDKVTGISEQMKHKVNSTDITGIINLAVNEQIDKQASHCQQLREKKNTGDYKIPLKEIAPLLKWIILGVATGLMALVSTGVIGH